MKVVEFGIHRREPTKTERAAGKTETTYSLNMSLRVSSAHEAHWLLGKILNVLTEEDLVSQEVAIDPMDLLEMKEPVKTERIIGVFTPEDSNPRIETVPPTTTYGLGQALVDATKK